MDEIAQAFQREDVHVDKTGDPVPSGILESACACMWKRKGGHVDQDSRV